MTERHFGLPAVPPASRIRRRRRLRGLVDLGLGATLALLTVAGLLLLGGYGG